MAAQQSLTASQREAIVELEGILTKISALDAGGWFQYPVTERDAPNYHSIIKQPMCFQVRDHLQKSYTLYLHYTFNTFFPVGDGAVMR
jgi:hypothetical protein